MTGRVIVLLDMDCFYVQVEERENSQIRGEPAAVVQYNTWKGGGIIAVNYEARSFGVKRGMRGEEAKEKCPSLHLVTVPVQRGKADLTKYRNAGKEVISVLCKFSDCVERASIDEAYIDFTKILEENCLNLKEKMVQAEDLPSTWVVGYEEDDDEVPSQTVRDKGLSCWLNGRLNSSCEDHLNILKLSFVAEICEQMRRKVFEETGFKCSAGISHNKMLAKLACGLHKPNQQTILPMKSVPLLWSHLPIGKVRNLGGKLGDSISSDFQCKTMGDLSKLSIDRLRSKYDEKTSIWLHSLGRGIENEAVTSRQLPKSIGCGKNFNGKEILNTKHKVNTWMKSLADELSERLLEDQTSNKRIAKTLTVHISVDSEEKPVTTRSSSLSSYKAEVIAKVAVALIANTNTASSKDEMWYPPIRNISLSAGKFEDLCIDGTTKINDIFKKVTPSTSRWNETTKDLNSEKVNLESGDLGNSKSERNKVSEDQQNGVEKNCQKSFFLQFLSQSSSEKMRKKFLADSGLDKMDNKSNGGHNALEMDEHSDQSDDEDYNKSTDVDEDEVENSLLVEVIDISSPSSSPVSNSRRSNSCIDTPRPQPQNVASTSKRSSLSDEDESESASVSVREIFPDLDNIDWSVAEMLPSPLRKKVYEEVQKHKRLSESETDKENLWKPRKSPYSSTPSIDSKSDNSLPSSGEKFTFCRECNRKILTINFLEHNDYHFASELRKQQMVEARLALGSTSRKREILKNSPVKSNRKKKQKCVTPIKNSTSKIEDYFKKK